MERKAAELFFGEVEPKRNDIVLEEKGQRCVIRVHEPSEAEEKEMERADAEYRIVEYRKRSAGGDGYYGCDEGDSYEGYHPVFLRSSEIEGYLFQEGVFVGVYLHLAHHYSGDGGDRFSEAYGILLKDGRIIGRNSVVDDYSVMNSSWSKYDESSSEFFLCRRAKGQLLVKEGTKKITVKEYFLCEELLEVILPQSVKTIEKEAFAKCGKLQKVRMHAGTIVSPSAFSDCPDLHRIEVIVPKEGIDIQMLGGYFSDKAVSLVDENGEELRHLALKGEGKLPENAFRNCASLEEVIIGEGIDEIGERAFEGCKGLTNVALPEGLKDIGPFAFASCEKLPRLALPQGLKAIPERMAAFCHALEEVTWPSSLERVGDGAFFQCDSLKEINLPESLQTLGYAAFAQCGSLSEIHIPSSLKAIPSHGFEYCYGLTELHIPSTVTEIGTGAFAACASLREVRISGNGALIVGNGAFESCQALSSIRIEGKIKSICYKAFGSCRSLVSLHFENAKINHVDGEAFRQCKNLAEATFDGATHIDERAFLDCPCLPRVDLVLTDLVCALENGFSRGKLFHYLTPNGGEIREIVVPEGVTKIKKRCFDGITFLERVVLPASVLEIGEYAFNGCSSLREVVFGNRLESIGDYAFYKTALTEVDLPSSLSSLGVFSFGACPKLEKVRLPSTLEKTNDHPFLFAAKNVEYHIRLEGSVLGFLSRTWQFEPVPMRLFDKQGKEITELSIPYEDGKEWETEFSVGGWYRYGHSLDRAPSLTKVSIGEGIRKIPKYAICNCVNLVSIQIPASVEEMDPGAFPMESLPNLETVVYAGSKEQWDAIEGHTRINLLPNRSLKLICADGEYVLRGNLRGF
ncbi:MAG: leucine-rich repeat domain-containing protein [Bacilli bacterium]|nr:leucine-rich repeat domain-containing protein [Bacilli bacterium]